MSRFFRHPDGSFRASAVVGILWYALPIAFVVVVLIVRGY